MQTNFEKDENGRVIINHEDIVESYTFSSNKEDRLLFWFNAPDGKRYLYKKNALGTVDYGEVLFYLIAKEVGFPCPEAKPCCYIGPDGGYNDGVICEDFVKDRTNTEQINGKSILRTKAPSANSIYNYVCCMDKWFDDVANKKNLTLEMDEFIMQTMMQQVLFDFLVLQADRHSSNIEFLATAKDGKLYVKQSPSFDNSWCFFMNRRTVIFDLYDVISRKPSDWESQVKEIINDSACFCFSVTGVSFVTRGQNGNENYKSTCDDVAESIYYEESVKELFEKLKRVDILKLTDEYTQKTGYKFPQRPTIVADALFKYQINVLQKSYDNFAKKTEMEQKGLVK